MFVDDAVILFQGDSVTDADRQRDPAIAAEPNRPAALGRGYAALLSARLLATHPGSGWCCFNRGVSGNRITDCYTRWRCDALHLRPDVISLLIGINDFWQDRTDRRDGVSPARFDQLYRMLLEDTCAALPEAVLILGEPFALPTGAFDPSWCAALAERQNLVRQIASDFDAVFVPYQAAFDLACSEAPPAYWADDGVHPSLAGHQRMADTWWQAVVDGLG